MANTLPRGLRFVDERVRWWRNDDTAVLDITVWRRAGWDLSGVAGADRVLSFDWRGTISSFIPVSVLLKDS